MPEYLSPGVYIEEVDRGPKPIEAVATAVAAFVGFTEKAGRVRMVDGEEEYEDLSNKPTLVTNWSQFVQAFGGFVQGAYLPHAVYGYFNNGGTRCYILSVKTIGKAAARFGNNLRIKAKYAGLTNLKVKISNLALLPASVSPAGEGEKVSGKRKGAVSQDTPPEEGQSMAAGPDEVKETAPSFTVTVLSKGKKEWIEREKIDGISFQYDKSAKESKRVQVAYQTSKLFNLIDLEVVNSSLALTEIQLADKQEQELTYIENVKGLEAGTSSEFKGDVARREGIGALEALDDVTMVCAPDLMATPAGSPDRDTVKAVQMALITHCERMKDRVAILDSLPNQNSQEVRTWRRDVAGFDSSYATLYYPWIMVDDPILNKPIPVPPCGHIAGIWARNDNTRGVHKAPANEVVLGAIGLQQMITKGEQDGLNPEGVNCIRAFPGQGIRVWGARTLSSNPSWRYLNVRRLFNMIEKSIERSTQWVVFEPNDELLWSRIRRDVSAFLSTVWSDGALFGASPNQAFYVKCDGELNTVEQRDLGRLIIEIGIAPVKPAEFVIFRISQWAGGG